MYTYIEEIIAANKKAGYHFFDRDTMRFFRSKVYDDVIGGRCFITSEQAVHYFPEYHKEPRLYTVRAMRDDSSIDEASEFQEFASLRAARKAAPTYAQCQEEPAG